MNETTTMKAAVLHTHGAPLAIASVARPEAGRGQVRVRVAASGVNPLDVKIHEGKADHARHPLPALLGIDLAGRVEAVGEGVTAFRVGDEVYGMTGGVGGVPGSLAEHAVVDADLLAPKPARLSFREAAALPLVVITAWEGLVDRAGVHAGQTVLILGAGGVGQAAIQIARARDAKVFAVDSAAKRLEIEALGATAIDYREAKVEEYVARYTEGRGFDVVYDTVGGAGLDTAFQAVRRFGHVVSCLGWGSHALAPLSFRAATYSGVFTLLPLLTGEGRAHHGEILREASRLADAGLLSARVDPRRFTLETVNDAHALLDAGGAKGKLVIDVDERA